MGAEPEKRRGPQGLDLLRDPALNRGTAFSAADRSVLGLDGLLPPAETELGQQAAASYAEVMRHASNLEKWAALRDLALGNETLFFHVARQHLSEILPLIYTPTIGEVAQQYSMLWRPARGLILHPGLRGRFEQILRSLEAPVQVIVATDGERVLGLGDQGLGGMAIAQGKVCLYSLFGGFSPASTLPVCLDVGTNHEGLLADPHYLGWRHPRLTGQDYDAFIEEFVRAVEQVWPGALLQWEDFGKHQARPVLERYRNQLLSFNDDIQGTAAVSLAGILAALLVKGESLLDQRIVILGGGSAGLGIAERLMHYHQRNGGSAAEMGDRIFVLDRRGLLTDLHPQPEPLQRQLAKSKALVDSWEVADPMHVSLEEVVRHAQPTILIGVSAHGGAFHESIIRQMTAHCPLPVIFPLSNPTSKAEAIPSDLVSWTNGKCLIATGSPFRPVPFGGSTIQIGQCNNLYIFPGVGMGCQIAGARRVTEGMLDRAAEVLASHSPALADPHLSLFPQLEDAVEIARQIAVAVALEAQKEGVAPPLTEQQLRDRLERAVWEPTYAALEGSHRCG
jgi:malate dehydrogenase (oxaloacetate-decarboxylating)